MNASVNRYFKRQKILLKGETVTPMFLGDARQEAQWRGAPFKALLRYWWRVTQHKCNDAQALLNAESKVFGFAGEKNEEAAGKSLVGVAVLSRTAPSRESLPQIQKIEHPECERQDGKIDPLLYLANMGIMGIGGAVKHSYFPANSSFDWIVDYPSSAEADLKVTLALVQAFGTVGARNRNGWGSFEIKSGRMDAGETAKLLTSCTEKWEKGFEKDYPNCLGRDEKGCLLWKTRRMPTWEAAMRELADTYVGIRARTVSGIDKLDANGKEYPAERHLLGFPLTNHPAAKAKNWGNKGRHGSSLRFVVHRDLDFFRGIVLHLPHRFSDDMNPMPKEKQIEVWDRVHRKLDGLKLDGLLERATYEECL